MNENSQSVGETLIKGFEEVSLAKIEYANNVFDGIIIFTLPLRREGYQVTISSVYPNT
jgi:hypothetical protein